MALKECSNCKVTKALDEYPYNPNTKNKRGSWCHECRAELMRNYRQNNKEKVRDYDRKYREENREKLNAWRRDYYHKNKTKILYQQRQWLIKKTQSQQELEP